MTPRTRGDAATVRDRPAPTRAATDDDLATRLSEVARQLQASDDLDQLLHDLVVIATKIIPGVDDASLSVVEGGHRVEARHPSSDLPRQVDALQTEVGQGPCLDAIHQHQTVRVPDLRHEPRWPRFTTRAHALGVGSMLSFRLYVAGDNLGALNLFSRVPAALGDAAERVGVLFASHAAIAFADAQQLDDAQTSIRSRDVIGQAKGMLMERYRISENRAFHVLVRYSESAHRRLDEVADELTRRGALPVLDRDPRGTVSTQLAQVAPGARPVQRPAGSTGSSGEPSSIPCPLCVTRTRG